jgi:hypothetical protein
MRRAFVLAAMFLCSCHGSDGGAATDAGPQPRAWQRLATPMSALPATRGLRPVRGILHSHSPYSHDACDGAGLGADGKPDATCAAALRRGVCEAAEDFVFLTDHSANMAAQAFEELFYVRAGDEPVRDATGAIIANRVACDDGRRVLLMVGNENALMTAGLERHLPGDAAARRSAYEADGTTAVDAMHATGALVWIPHTESRPDAYLAATPFDGIEIYNLHAAIDPDIRKDYFGLDPYAAVVNALPFTSLDPVSPEPDLTLLAFYEELPIYATKWDKLLATRHVPGSVGTDVHQNTIPGIERDGERGDSYRRLMRWFSNVLLIDGEITPASVKQALAHGRGYVATDILGVPEGLDFHAEASGKTYELGDAAPVGATLVATAPVVHDLDPAVTPPTITMRLLRITSAGTTVVGEGSSITVPSAAAGAYRVEVRMTPEHLRPYLGETPDQWIREEIWIRGNPIYVE